jgi:radical SAM superfamily enzyme YgiQ (UPF0313 family)
LNALLVYPRFPDTFWSFKYALRFVRKKAAYPPLGLLTVSSLLPISWSRRLVDMNVAELRAEDLEWADCVCLSAMTVQRESAREVIAQCREAGVRVIAGGPLFTCEPDDFPGVDHLVLGEAELSLPPFLADFGRGAAKRVYRAEGFADMARSPIPDYSLLDPRHYSSMCVQYSRGCPFNCDFCNVTSLLGHLPRIKEPGQILAELGALYALGWRDSVFFVDDNLIGNMRGFATELLPALEAWCREHPGLAFNTQASINLADHPQLTARMVATGFVSVFIGIETPHEAGLAECAKKQNLGRDLGQDVVKLHRAGLQVQGGFIVGFDADTPASFLRLTDFIQKTGIVTAMVGLLQAFPGTRLYARMEKEGRLRPGTSGDNFNGTTNIIHDMDADVLHHGYREGMRRLYAPRQFYRRLHTFLKDYRVPPAQTQWSLALLAGQAVAFLRSMAHLGIVGRERFYYWRLLVWTALRRPRSLPLAITLAIYGHHFRRTCDLHLKALRPVASVGN